MTENLRRKLSSFMKIVWSLHSVQSTTHTMVAVTQFCSGKPFSSPTWWEKFASFRNKPLAPSVPLKLLSEEGAFSFCPWIKTWAPHAFSGHSQVSFKGVVSHRWSEFRNAGVRPKCESVHFAAICALLSQGWLQAGWAASPLLLWCFSSSSSFLASMSEVL